MFKKEKLRLAIIDSGYTKTYRALKNPIAEIINLRDDVQEGVDDQYGHGTAITVLTDRFCSEIEFYIIKVLDKLGRCSSRHLLQALELAISKHVDIINLSLGTRDMSIKHEFQELCNKAYEKGIVIVTTCENEVTDCVPFICDKTIKVRANRCIKDSTFFYNKNVFYCKGVEHLLPWKNNTFIYSGSNSFSTPYIVKEIVNLKRKGYNREDILAGLIEKSRQAAVPRYLCIEEEEYLDERIYHAVEEVTEQILGKNIDKVRLSLQGMSDEISIQILLELQNKLEKGIYFEDFNYIDFEYVNNISHRLETAIFY